MNKKRLYHNFLNIIILTGGVFLLAFLNLRLTSPPPVVSSGAPPGEFSAERAAEHLEIIAVRPNPLGSAENDSVREYIFTKLQRMGHEAIIHNAVVRKDQTVAKVGNVLARIEGKGNGEAIVFMAHFDTVADAPGASDNGAGVATLLELTRMLGHYPPLHNDIILLFTDGEEQGLLGARAFAEEHPWMDDIIAVINLEAMGSRGPSIMFETGHGNLLIIKEFARAASRPLGFSVSTEIYKRMPNITDFDIFKQRGYQGLNFAYIGGSYHYHTPGDNLENIDLRSVQHHGSHASSLALHLGNHKGGFDANEDAVYFNTLGKGFVFYPYSMTRPLAIAIILLLSLVFIIAAVRKKISFLGPLRGFVGFVLLIAVIYFLFSSIYESLTSFYQGSENRMIQYHQEGIFAAAGIVCIGLTGAYFIMLLRGVKKLVALACLAMLYLIILPSGESSLPEIVLPVIFSAWLLIFHRKPIKREDLFAGTLILWAIVMTVSSFLLPGASFLFTWPLATGLISFSYLSLIKRDSDSTGIPATIFILLMSAPVVLSFPVILVLFNNAMGLGTLGISMTLVALSGGLLVPHFSIINRNWPNAF